MMRNVKSWLNQELAFFYIAPVIMWQLLFFIIPLFLVLGFGIYSQETGSFTLEFLKDVLHPAQCNIILNSIILATTTACITLCIAYPVAYFIALRIKKYKVFFLFLLMLPFLINLLVQVYSWFFILEKSGIVSELLQLVGILSEPVNFLDNPGVVFVVMVHIYLPFMIMPIYSILEKFDYRLIEASYDLGSSFSRTFTHVIFPLTKPGVQIGFFIVFVTSFGEYIIPSLVGGNKKFYVGTLIAEYFFVGKNWSAGAAFIILSIIALFLFSLLYNFILQKLTIGSDHD